MKGEMGGKSTGGESEDGRKERTITGEIKREKK